MVIDGINGQYEKDKMKEFFSIQELAERWGYEERTVRHWAKEGRLEDAVQFGRKILIPRHAIFRFEAEHRIKFDVTGVPNA